mgnify:CR=1 FL=1
MNDKYEKIIEEYGHDIINNPKYLKQKEFIQHGHTSVYSHEHGVTLYSLKIADKLRLKVDEKSLVRGALLHDYFLYDWHEKHAGHNLHGFTHAKRAMQNASEDYDLNKIEKNMISTHMFPLNLRIPRYKESIVLCLADKIVATKETINRKNKNAK